MKNMIKSSVVMFTLITSSIAFFPAHTMEQTQKGPRLNDIYYTGAAVLPFTYFPENGKLVKSVVLSRERSGRDRGTWDAFGGSRDRGEKPLITASREFAEESIAEKTLGLNNDDASRYIDLPAGNTETILAKQMDNQGPNGKPRFFVTYLTHFKPEAIISFRRKFNPARLEATKKIYQEKDGIAVARWSDMEHSIKGSQSDYGITVKAREFDFITNHDKPESNIVLRPLLVKMLRPHMENAPHVPGEDDRIHFYF